MTNEHPSSRSPSLVASEPAARAVVTVDAPLMQRHPPPGWVLPVRLVVVAAAGFALPVQGIALALALVVLWIGSVFVVRYPVRLTEGRALFVGGLTNTGEPGRYWLRRRWRESAFSIPLDVIRVDWAAAPTRLEDGEGHAWLELSLEAWARPRDDEAGQFQALMQYRGWQEHRSLVARSMREALIEAMVEHMVEHIERAGGLARLPRDPWALGERLWPAVDAGLRSLGLALVQKGRLEARLVANTEQLVGEDRVRIDRAPPR